MADQYIVKAAAAVVQTKDGEHYRYRGALVPSDAKNLEHLSSAGLVEIVAPAEPESVQVESPKTGQAKTGQSKTGQAETETVKSGQ